MTTITSHYFNTNDGVKLHYLDTGEGKPLIMLPGGGFSADIFKHQIAALSKHHRLIILDKRAHGLSEMVEYGCRVSRLAKDFDDLLKHLQLDKVDVLGHSLGAAMIFNYMDLFGCDAIDKFVSVDETAAMLENPIWSEKEKKEYGTICDLDSLYNLTNSFLEEDGAAERTKNLVNFMTSDHATDEQKEFIGSCLQISGYAANRIYFNNISRDFRDIPAKIKVPTLFIGGKASSSPWQAEQWWHQQVPGSQLEIFGEEEGGGHFMFVENPEKFNALVTKFLTAA